jgi:hypothetical protein
MANKNKGVDQVLSNVKSVDVMDKVRAGLAAIRGMGATPEAVAKMTAVLVKSKVDMTPVKNRSVVGFNVTGFQNVLYVCNARDGWKFTDAELAVAWAVCLPGNNPTVAKGAGFTSDPTKYVGGTRTAFNGKKHGPLPTGYEFVKSERYVGAKAPAPVAKKTVSQKSVPQPTEAELPTAAPTDAPVEIVTPEVVAA